MRAATCQPDAPNRALEGKARPSEQTQHLGLRLVRPSLGA